MRDERGKMRGRAQHRLGVDGSIDWEFIGIVSHIVARRCRLGRALDDLCESLGIIEEEPVAAALDFLSSAQR